MDNDSIAETVRQKDLEIIKLIKERNEAAKLLSRDRIENIETCVRELFAEEGEAAGLDPSLMRSIAASVCEQSHISCPVPLTDDPKRISIVGGAGKMGKWTGDLLSAAGHEIDVIDPASGNGRTLEDCKDSDIVIVSVPIHAADGVLRTLDKICKDEALIFDLTSLKSTIVSTLRDMASRRNVCSVHPMFGPSAKSMYGRNMIICDCGNAFAVKQASDLFSGRGANIRVMDVDDHDKYMSYVLGLSHAVNIVFFTVLERSGITYRDMQSVASTTFRKNMDTNLSVALEDPTLYYEIQHMNSHRDEMLEMCIQAVKDLREASLSDDGTQFRDLMDRGRRYFTQ